MGEKINNTPTPILRARASLIARLVREVAGLVRKDTGRLVDEEKLEQIVACWLPLSAAEAQAEYDAAAEAEAGLATTPSLPVRPSAMDRLRKALGHDGRVSLHDTLTSAAEHIERHRPADND